MATKPRAKRKGKREPASTDEEVSRLLYGNLIHSITGKRRFSHGGKTWEVDPTSKTVSMVPDAKSDFEMPTANEIERAVIELSRENPFFAAGVAILAISVLAVFCLLIMAFTGGSSQVVDISTSSNYSYNSSIVAPPSTNNITSTAVFQSDSPCPPGQVMSAPNKYSNTPSHCVTPIDPIGDLLKTGWIGMVVFVVIVALPMLAILPHRGD